MFQDKTATLVKAANLINSVILSFENARCTHGFSDLWLAIKTFCDKNNVELTKPFQTKSQYCVLTNIFKNIICNLLSF